MIEDGKSTLNAKEFCNKIYKNEDEASSFGLVVFKKKKKIEN